jgi:murein L,D-transpeptidase YafK
MHSLYGDYAAIYGSGAYPLNYPNPIDRIKKRTGSGIWVHGLNPNGHKPNTEGCIAMENIDFDRVTDRFDVGMPVVVLDNASFMTEGDYIAERERQIGFLQDFLAAWSGGDYDRFASYVHPEYKSYAAANAKAYLTSKGHLMKLYPEKQVQADDINIYVQTDNTAVYDFNQFYCAANVVTYSNKRIYLSTDEDKYKIISEEIRSKALAPYLDPHVKEFVDKWRQDWESADIESYMANYDTAFPARAKWQESKENLFNTNATIKVELEDIKWSGAGGNLVRVSFIQNYSADTLSDRGRKTLLIKGCPGNYKILSEDWRAL